MTSLPMFILGYLSYDITRSALKTEATHRIETIQFLMQSNFERWINGNIVLLRSLAQRPLVKKLSEKIVNNPDLRPQLLNKLLINHFQPALGGNGGFDHLSLLHPDSGEVLTSTTNKKVGQFRERSRYFTEGRYSLFVDKLIYNPTSAETHLHISIPVMGPDGRLLSVLAGSVDWREMWKILDRGNSKDRSVETYLINSFAYPIVLPSKGHEDLPSYAFRSVGIDKCLTELPGGGEYMNYNGTEVVGVYQWFSGYGFCMLTEQPADEVFHALSELTQKWVLIFLITLLVTVAISLLVTRRMLLPLNKLLFGVNIVKGGELSYRIPQPSKDEIGKVANSFNSMLDQLELLTISREKLTREINERKLVEHRLRDAEILYRTLFDQSPDGILLVDPETMKITQFNQSAHEILGWSRKEFSKKTIYDIEAEFDYDRLKTLVRRLKQQRTLDFNSQLKCSDNTKINVKVTLSMVEIEGKEFIHSVFRDISEILQRMNELELSESRFRRAITEAPFPVLIHTNDGEILQFSDSWLSLTGYGISEVSNISELSGTVIPSDFEQFATAVDQIKSNDDKVVEGEYSIQAKNGHRMVWDFSSARVGKLPDQRSVYMRMAVDITQRYKNQKKLEQSNKDLQQFAYVASHDLQEPLRVITGFIELFAKRYQGQLDDKADQYIEFITDGAQRMRNLISGLLGYSRVISKPNPRKEFNLNEVVNDVIQDLSLLIEDSKTKIVFENLPSIIGDEGQIKQVFQNLISNAIKFNKNESPKVQIKSQFVSGNWIFSVCDNGIGIDEKYRGRIFDIFQRLHSREDYEGTGIGLAITKRVIERHGGEIKVYESESGGSCFSFNIPPIPAADILNKEET